MEHKILQLGKQFCLDDDSKPIIRIENEFLVYIENNEYKTIPVVDRTSSTFTNRIRFNENTTDFVEATDVTPIMEAIATKDSVSYDKFEMQFLIDGSPGTFMYNPTNQTVTFVMEDSIETIKVPQNKIEELDNSAAYTDESPEKDALNGFNVVNKDETLEWAQNGKRLLEGGLNEKSILSGETIITNCYKLDDNNHVYSVVKNNETYCCIESSDKYAARCVQSLKFNHRDNPFILHGEDNSPYGEAWLSYDGEELIIGNDIEKNLQVMAIDDTLNIDTTVTMLVRDKSTGIFSNISVGVDDNFLKQTSIKIEGVAVSDEKIEGLSNIPLKIEPNVPFVENEIYLDNIKFNKENGDLIAVEHLNGKANQKKYTNVAILSDDDKTISCENEGNMKTYSVRCEQKDWDVFSKDVNQIRIENSHIRTLGCIEDNVLNTKSFIQSPDGTLENFSKLKYTSNDGDFIIYSKGEQLKYICLSPPTNEPIDDNNIVFTDLKNNIVVDNTGPKIISEADVETYKELLKGLNIESYKDFTFNRNLITSGRDPNSLLDDAKKLYDNDLTDVIIKNTRSGVTLSCKEFKDVYIDDMYTANSVNSQNRLFVKIEGKDYAVASFDDSFKCDNIKKLVDDTSKQLGTFDRHNIFVISGSSDIWTKFSNEYISINNLDAKPVPVDDAKIDYIANVDGKMYRKILSKCEDEDATVTIVTGENPKILVDKTSDKDIYNNSYTSIIDIKHPIDAEDEKEDSLDKEKDNEKTEKHDAVENNAMEI